MDPLIIRGRNLEARRNPSVLLALLPRVFRRRRNADAYPRRVVPPRQASKHRTFRTFPKIFFKDYFEKKNKRDVCGTLTFAGLASAAHFLLKICYSVFLYFSSRSAI